MRKLIYKIQKAVFNFLGDLRWHGILHPLWFTINARQHLLEGYHCRLIEKLILPGDVLIRRCEGYVDKWLIPGWWTHAGIYYGDLGSRKHQVIHAMGEGVVTDDLIDFMRTDHLIVLRPPKHCIDSCLQYAKDQIGKEYDFDFNFDETNEFSCTELVGYCYSGLIEPKRRFFRMSIIADDIVASHYFSRVWISPWSEKHDRRRV